MSEQPYSPGDVVTDGERRYVVLRPLEDYDLYVEGDHPGINDTPVRRKHLPVALLPDIPQFIDQSALPFYPKEARS